MRASEYEGHRKDEVGLYKFLLGVIKSSLMLRRITDHGKKNNWFYPGCQLIEIFTKKKIIKIVKCEMFMNILFMNINSCMVPGTWYHKIKIIKIKQQEEWPHRRMYHTLHVHTCQVLSTFSFKKKKLQSNIYIT